jgi:hypothetical protein
MSVSGDMGRRVVVCRIDAKTESPDSRQFNDDPRDLARENRAQLVVDALTIIKAYVEAGKPTTLNKMGSFEEWTIVREALVWLGCADPADTRKMLSIGDAKKSELATLLPAWEQCFGGEYRTLAQVQEYCNTSKPEAKILLNILLDMTGKNFFNSKSIGKCLAKNLDIIIGDRMLKCKPDVHGASWAVVKVSKLQQLSFDDETAPY